MRVGYADGGDVSDDEYAGASSGDADTDAQTGSPIEPYSMLKRAAPGYQAGGAVAPKRNWAMRHDSPEIHRYMGGEGATSPRDTAAIRHMASQHDPSLNHNSLTTKVVHDFAKVGNHNMAARLIQAHRRAANPLRAHAVAAYEHGHMGNAVRLANAYHEHIPDARQTTYTAHPQGVGVHVQRLGPDHKPTGPASTHMLHPEQFRQHLMGPGSDFDHVIDNGVENNLHTQTGQNAPQGYAGGGIVPGGGIAPGGGAGPGGGLIPFTPAAPQAPPQPVSLSSLGDQHFVQRPLVQYGSGQTTMGSTPVFGGAKGGPVPPRRGYQEGGPVEDDPDIPYGGDDNQQPSPPPAQDEVQAAPADQGSDDDPWSVIKRALQYTRDSIIGRAEAADTAQAATPPEKATSQEAAKPWSERTGGLPGLVRDFLKPPDPANAPGTRAVAGAAKDIGAWATGVPQETAGPPLSARTADPDVNPAEQGPPISERTAAPYAPTTDMPSTEDPYKPAAVETLNRVGTSPVQPRISPFTGKPEGAAPAGFAPVGPAGGVGQLYGTGKGYGGYTPSTGTRAAPAGETKWDRGVPYVPTRFGPNEHPMPYNDIRNPNYMSPENRAARQFPWASQGRQRAAATAGGERSDRAETYRREQAAQKAGQAGDTLSERSAYHQGLLDAASDRLSETIRHNNATEQVGAARSVLDNARLMNELNKLASTNDRNALMAIKQKYDGNNLEPGDAETLRRIIERSGTSAARDYTRTSPQQQPQYQTGDIVTINGKKYKVGAE